MRRVGEENRPPGPFGRAKLSEITHQGSGPDVKSRPELTTEAFSCAAALHQGEKASAKPGARDGVYCVKPSPKRVFLSLPDKMSDIEDRSAIC